MRASRLAASVLALSIVGLIGCGPCRQSGTRILSESCDWSRYGKALGGTVSSGTLSQAVADPPSFTGRPVLLRDAEIDTVSRTDGGWMLVRDGGSPVRVLLDGFQVPTDSAGRSAMIEGVLEEKTVPEATARRYLEEAGRHAEASKLVGDQKELTFVATGVRLSPK